MPGRQPSPHELERRIRKDILFPSFQPIEEAQCCENSGEAFRDLEASGLSACDMELQPKPQPSRPRPPTYVLIPDGHGGWHYRAPMN